MTTRLATILKQLAWKSKIHSWDNLIDNKNFIGLYDFHATHKECFTRCETK